MKTRPRIYVAGAYSADNVIDVLSNIRKGNQVAAKLLKAGFAPFSPFIDYQFSFFEDITVDEYYDYSIAWLLVSDAMLVLPGYENSKGTLREIEIATKSSIPVFYYQNNFIELIMYFNEIN